MFDKTARFYDALYSFKDYSEEAQRLHDLIQNKAPGARSLLDAACGTGAHARHLSAHYEIVGVDLDPEMVRLAAERNPGIEVQVADMTELDLGRTFDAIVCLFSAIGYVVTIERLNKAIAGMAAHLRPEGVLIVEPWHSPEQFQDGLLQVLTATDGDTEIVRMMHTSHRGKISEMTAEYLIGTPDGIVRETEVHRLGLFEDKEYRSAFEAAGLTVELDEAGLIGRGLYIATRR